MRTLRIYSLKNFYIYHTAVLIIFMILSIASLVLIYLITGSWYLLATLIQSPFPQTPASGNTKSDLFSACFLSGSYVVVDERQAKSRVNEDHNTIFQVLKVMLAHSR